MEFYVYDLTTNVVILSGDGPAGTAEANILPGWGFKYVYGGVEYDTYPTVYDTYGSDVDRIKLALSQEVLELRKMKKLQGIIYTSGGVDYAFRTDPAAVAEFMLTWEYYEGGGGGSGSHFYIANDEPTSGIAGMSYVKAHLIDYLQGCYTQEANLLSSIAAASDITALEAIDITAGWPSNTYS